MKEARFLFKCRRCGAIDESLCCGVDHALVNLIGAMNGKNDGPEQWRHWKHGFPVRMLSSHHCNRLKINSVGEEVGVTDLIGYKIVETE